MANNIQEFKKRCDICKKRTQTDITSELEYGPWKQKSDIVVHYYCLLLSTGLEQNNNDNSGILGFGMRDIRRYITKMASQECCFCMKDHATIRCQKCQRYFHLVCGKRRGCVNEFVDNFISYCVKCYQLNDFQREMPKEPTNCYICKGFIIMDMPANWIYGPCCGNGFVHAICMRRYAQKAGYYLKCIWCKSEAFRDMIRRMGIFVPDKDAEWEHRKAFGELHRGHRHCDMETCLCPRGRDFFSAKWALILCECCGGFGAHNPICVSGEHNAKSKIERFQCSTCKAIELKTAKTNMSRLNSYHQLESESESNDMNLPLQVSSNSATSNNNESLYQSNIQTPVPTTSAANDPITPIGSDNSMAYKSTDATSNAKHLDAENVESCFSHSSVETIQMGPNQTNADESNFKTFRCVTFDNPKSDEPTGMAIVRVDLNSPRFRGMSELEISDNSMNLLTPADIIFKTDELSLVSEIRRVIHEFAKSLEEEKS